MDNISIIINVIIQIINLIIFFFIFKYFFSGPIVDAVEKRKKMLEQFKNADDILQKKLTEAEQERQRFIKEGLEHKNNILQEATQQAENYIKSIKEQAEYEKEKIIEKGENEIKVKKEELEAAWEMALKKGIYTIYERIIGKDEEFIKKYLEKVDLKNYK